MRFATKETAVVVFYSICCILLYLLYAAVAVWLLRCMGVMRLPRMTGEQDSCMAWGVV